MSPGTRMSGALALSLAAAVMAMPLALAADIRGTDGPDDLVGTTQGDRIDARSGDDTVAALDGRDTVFGGFGEDTIDGGPGPDDLRGGPDADRVEGGPGSDRISGVGADLAHGGDDDDLLRAARGSSVLHGDAGADQLRSDLTSGRPQLHGDEGDDSLVATRLDDEGPRGHAVLYGGRGADYLQSDDDGEVRGGPDDDEVLAAHASMVDGGDGDDRLVTESVPAARTPMRCGPGTDSVEGDVEDVFPDDCEQVVVTITGPAGGEARVSGTPYDDRVSLLDGGNVVETYGGDDQVVSGFGGAGDEIFAGAGDDVVITTNSSVPRADSISCGPGHDEVRAGPGDEIAADCEDVTVFFYGFDEDDVVNGTAFRDVVDTNAGRDTIRGRGGADEIYPGDDADTVDAGSGDDVVSAYGDGAIDHISCGRGLDRVEGADPLDVVSSDCEIVAGR